MTRTIEQQRQLVEDLNAAHDWLGPHNWIQGAWFSGDNSCALGACQRVLGRTDVNRVPEWNFPRYRAMRTALDATVTETEGIMAYNDGVARNVDDVKDKFQQAIKNECAALKLMEQPE